jgi:hypothetical protein
MITFTVYIKLMVITGLDIEQTTLLPLQQAKSSRRVPITSDFAKISPRGKIIPSVLADLNQMGWMPSATYTQRAIRPIRILALTIQAHVVCSHRLTAAEIHAASTSETQVPLDW